MRAEELAAELERFQHSRQQISIDTNSSGAFSADLRFSDADVGGVRGTDTGPPAPLSSRQRQPRFGIQLNLKGHGYPSYGVSLQAVGGREIFSRQNIKPKTTESGASFALIVPGRKIAPGDYILTLRSQSWR